MTLDNLKKINIRNLSEVELIEHKKNIHTMNSEDIKNYLLHLINNEFELHYSIEEDFSDYTTEIKAKFEKTYKQINIEIDKRNKIIKDIIEEFSPFVPLRPFNFKDNKGDNKTPNCFSSYPEN